MSTVRFSSFKQSMLFRRNPCSLEQMKSFNIPKKHSKVQNEEKGESIEWSFVGTDQLILMMEIHKKIIVFRDIMDLSPLNTSVSLREMIITTLEDLQRLYHGIIPSQKVSNIKDKSIDQGLAHFCKALKSLGELWMMNNDCMDNRNFELPSCKDNINMQQIGETVLAILDCLIKIASEKFDIMEEEDSKKEFSLRSSSTSPMTPKSVLLESPRSSYNTSLWSLRIQAVGKLNPMDLKRLSYHMSPPNMEKEQAINLEMDHKARNPRMDTSKDMAFDLDTKTELDRTTSDHEKTYQALQPQNLKPNMAMPPPPPPPKLLKPGSTPPPPPPGAWRSLRPKATTKLKRSTQLGNLYLTLKGKVEGSNIKGKSSCGRTNTIGSGSLGGKQGMADALAEMTKRSSYFQQIEEDTQRYRKKITELRSAITNFKTKEMTELIKFHTDIESVLENLTDESQVLSRFEGFPFKKLEAIRMAAALYHRLDSILSELQNWNVVTPVVQLLEKVERYFNKIKTELDAMERTKDEESKKLKGHNIDFDFYILIKIKEAMVDVSSNCMELALKEKRNELVVASSKRKSNEGKRKESGNKMLWRAFQLAFRVYTFAGGHDDRADKLTRELAKEIESDPYHL